MPPPEDMHQISSTPAAGSASAAASVPNAAFIRIDPMLDIADVERAVKLKKSAIYARVRVGEFPAPYRLFGQRVAWKCSEVQAFLNTLERVKPTEGGI